MSENNLEGEQRERSKEAQFVDKNEAALIERVTSVMPIADELKSKDMLHGEKYDEIRAEVTNQRKMRKLFESLKSGDTVKIAFYELLEKHELPLFKELGGVCRKRKLADPESPVPCKRVNTGSNEQDNLNFNNASTSAQRPAPAYTTVYNIVNERPPSYNMENIRYSIVPKTEWKPIKPPAPNKEKNSPAPKKEKKPLIPKVKNPPALKKEKKPPVPKVKKPPTPKKKKKPPAPKIKKPPVPKVKKPPAPKKNKPPVPKIKKPPVPKVKKPPAPKKVKKPAGRK
ncbi:proteoglycan 4-like [Megalobrama amblycephala]|uniref:proteoglycan 4-like n=1 Tax=Megalobrama amblycephala TaxID=75352 RepID=UPI0020142628|nr:proteoglycan 4-like [Megalobrama amblycephala]